MIKNGEILGVVPKQNLPNYSEFYERRQFVPCDKTSVIFSCRDLPEFSFGVEICEDLWTVSPPSNVLAVCGANIIVNLSASHALTGKSAYRRSLVAGQSARIISGYVYAGAGAGESTSDMVFGGHKMIAENGTMLAEAAPFSDAFSGGEMIVSEIHVHSLGS